jgi:hypothetical protein
MSRFKILAIVFSMLAFGSVQEVYRIFTSMDKDIVENRQWLIIIATNVPLLFLFLSIRFWRKAANEKRF